jgi:methyltransferase (TIGR00027 family)
MSIMNSFYTGTARWIAAARARETNRPDRLFNDPFAAALAGAKGFDILARAEKAYGGVNPYIPVRTRFFDDLIMSHADALPQIALLGAGLDTRAFRLDFPPEIHLFELDLPETLAYKESVVKAYGGAPRCIRHVVSTDLSGSWTGDLLAAGFDLHMPTQWIAEGLFFYLSEPAVRKLIESARECSAPGSLFAADIMGSGVLDQPQLEEYLRWLGENNAPLPFCTSSPSSLFQQLGWEIERLTSPGAPDADYGRLPLQTPPSKNDEPDRAYFIVARR